jgi:phosphopantetheinyl transferase
MHKFLSADEMEIFRIQPTEIDISLLTTLWSCKESVFKWYGNGGVDFKKDIRLSRSHDPAMVDCQFRDSNRLPVHIQVIECLVLAWTMSNEQ